MQAASLLKLTLVSPPHGTVRGPPVTSISHMHSSAYSPADRSATRLLPSSPGRAGPPPPHAPITTTTHRRFIPSSSHETGDVDAAEVLHATDVAARDRV